MELLVIRHAIAEYTNLGTQDKDRPLSLKGRELFNQLCKQLNFLDLKFDFLLDSPLLRSKQTADIFCDHFSVENRKTSDSLKPSENPEAFLIELATMGATTGVIIGHQPFLNQFINYCLSTDTREFIVLKRGAMAFLEFPVIVKEHSAILKALLDPKFLVNTHKK